MTIRFYGHRTLPYGCFSNFSEHGFTLDGLYWQTSEHYFQAQKFVDTPHYERVRLAPTPGAAAAIGRNRSLPLRPDWESVKDQVMKTALIAKFAQNPDIQAVLLGTGEQLLIEDAPHDYYWGCGKDGTGKNQLGKLLMEVRTYFVQQQSRLSNAAEQVRALLLPSRVTTKSNTNSNDKFDFPSIKTRWTKQQIETWLQQQPQLQPHQKDGNMNRFGSDYPPGCHSLPWDNEEEDERSAFERWLDRWFGTAWTFKQHYIRRRSSRDKSGWRYTLTVLWVYSLYLYWHGWQSFNLRLSLLKAGQRCQPDEQEAQLVLKINTTSGVNLARLLHFTLSASLPPIEEEAAKVEDAETGFFAAPMQPLMQWQFVLEERQGYGATDPTVYLIERRDQEGNTLNTVDLCSTLALVETAIATYLKEGLEAYEDVGDWYFSVLEWTVDDFSPLSRRVVQRISRHNIVVWTKPVSIPEGVNNYEQ